MRDLRENYRERERERVDAWKKENEEEKEGI